MDVISLVCEKCGGNMILDSSHEICTCEHCLTKYAIKENKIIHQTIKNVYGYEGKDVEELLIDGYKLLSLGDHYKANNKFEKAIDIEPNCWDAWYGYALTGGDRCSYLSAIYAYRKAYDVANEENQEIDTFVSMVCCILDADLRGVFIRKFNLASQKERRNIFRLVSNVIGCDESEMASLAIDMCPNDWRAHFAMAKSRQIRARWCDWAGSSQAIIVSNFFMQAYHLAKKESEEAKQTIITYIDNLVSDDSYKVFATGLKNRIKRGE